MVRFPSAAAGARAVRGLRAATALCVEVLSWQHGALDVFSLPPPEQALRLPESWRPYVVRPDFLGAIFEAYERARTLPFVLRAQLASEQQQQQQQRQHFQQQQQQQPMTHVPDAAHDLRQLLILLASVSGRIFAGGFEERAAYVGFMAKGTMKLLERPLRGQVQALAQGALAGGLGSPSGQGQQLVASYFASQRVAVDANEAGEAETKDVCALLRRLVATFGLRCLAGSASLPPAEFRDLLGSLARATDELVALLAAKQSALLAVADL